MSILIFEVKWAQERLLFIKVIDLKQLSSLLERGYSLIGGLSKLIIYRLIP